MNEPLYVTIMKRMFFIPLMLLATLMVAMACGKDETLPDEQEQSTSGGEDGNESEEGGDVDGTNGRYVVLYCSRTGNTSQMAQTIQSALDCDMIEVVPAIPYDEDYNAMLDRAQSEIADIAQGDFPAVTTEMENFDEYDIIFIGYPIWYGHMATPMQSFLHNHAELLAGKRIALFASSGSSGISASEREAASLVPEASFEESLLLTSSSLGSVETRIPSWLEGLGANREEGGGDDTPVSGNSIRLTLENGTAFTATLADNSSAEALKNLLAEGGLTIEMSDYGNMEKVGPIGQSLPRNDEHITTSAGDLILYQGSNLVIYYAPNTYTFTRLGRIDNVEEDELRTALGEGNVTVTLSLNNNE